MKVSIRNPGSPVKLCVSSRMPIRDAMEAWMKTVSLQCTPLDLLGKAIDYVYKLWPRLRRYALDGNYQIDNNAVERCQRPSVLGRKNYLLSKSDGGRRHLYDSSYASN